MELELGLKLTRAADDFISDFQIAKDRTANLFLSRETDTMFLLTAHLKGYKRENIKIDINADGILTISGERQVKETVIVNWIICKNDTETKAFKKNFRIPDGVILDKIKAKFNEEESTFEIKMPKEVKGIRGINVKEIKDNHEVVEQGSSSNLQVGDENGNNQITGSSDEGNGEKEKHGEKPEEQGNVHDEHLGKNDEIQKISEAEGDVHETNIEEEEEEDEGHDDHKSKGKKCKICIPIVVGSTLLLSFVVFVFQMIRSKNRTSTKRD